MFGRAISRQRRCGGGYHCCSEDIESLFIETAFHVGIGRQIHRGVDGRTTADKSVELARRLEETKKKNDLKNLNAIGFLYVCACVGSPRNPRPRRAVFRGPAETELGGTRVGRRTERGENEKIVKKKEKKKNNKCERRDRFDCNDGITTAVVVTGSEQSADVVTETAGSWRDGAACARSVKVSARLSAGTDVIAKTSPG